MIYFNEFESFAAEWLGNLSPESTIDTRSITDVKADDVIRFDRCHFFGGIGGWEYALQLAGWPKDRPVWTGSCPCQPFSSAGKQKAQADDRHLWPEMFRLIRECRPDTVFGEQVASAVGHGWLDGIFTDLEAEGYTCGAAVLGAYSVGSPHKRQRLYWVGYSSSKCRNIVRDIDNATKRRGVSIGTASDYSRLVQSSESGLQGYAGNGNHRIEPGWVYSLEGGSTSSPVAASVMGDTNIDGRESRESASTVNGHWRSIDSASRDAWSEFDIAHFVDGKTRRIEPGSFPLAYGVPKGMGRGDPQLGKLVRSARANRNGRLRGYGNAIVPQLAAEFIRAFMEVERERNQPC